jgi:hypothetical protein
VRREVLPDTPLLGRLWVGRLVRYLSGIPTSRYILAGVLIASVAAACNGLRKVAYADGAAAVAWVFDLAGFGLFFLAYAMLWLLLVVGPFRPYSKFSLHGHVGRRVGNFLGALAALVALHVVLAFGVASAGS